MSEKLILILGSNMGERLQYIGSALEEIEKNIGVIETLSPLYESEPWGFECDKWFLNQAVTVRTALPSEAILEVIQRIESELGRTRQKVLAGYASRTIDIDILFYGQEVLQTPALSIPHPHIEKRRFVLLPLVDIAADFKHPLTAKTPIEMLASCPDKSKVVLYKPEIPKPANEI